MRKNKTKSIALGGVLAATAVVIMCLGGLIPIATYVCPMLCCLIQCVVARYCGNRIGWAWFAVVAILSLLMSPDKEAALVFMAIGSYPLLKRSIENYRFSLLLKLLFFNCAILLAYCVMIHVLGMQHIAQENMQFGLIGVIVILLMGNVTFFLLDKLLDIMDRKLR